MNMFTKKLNWLIMSMMLMVSGSAWAGEESIDFSQKGYANGDVVETVKATNFTVTFAQGTNTNNAPKYYTTGAAVRAYGGNTFTVSSDYTITTITLTFASGEGTNKITTDVGTFESPDWTGSEKSVTFTIDGASGHRRIQGIKVTFDDGGTVVTKTLSSIALSGTYPTTFQEGDEFSHEGMTVTATYNDESTADVTSKATFSGYDMSSVGEQTVTVTYEEEEVTKTATYTITVNENEPPVQGGTEETIDFSKQGFENGETVGTVESTNFTVTFDQGENANNAPKYYSTGTAVRAYGGNTFTVSSDYTITKITLTFASGEGNNAITTDVGTFKSPDWTGSANSITFTIGGTTGHRRIQSIKVTLDDGGTIVTKTLSSIALSGEYPTEFQQGDAFSHEGMTVTATYDDESTADVTSKATFSGYDMSSVGEQTVTVTYEEGEVTKTATYTITVTEKAPVTIEDGVFDFAIGENYGSGYEYSEAKTQSGTWTAVNVTMALAGRNCWYESTTDGSTTLRLYKKYSDEAPAGSMEFTVPAGNVITKIVFEGKELGNLVAEGGTYKDGTWTGAANPIKISAKDNATKTIIITKITVTYGEGTPVEKKEAGLAYTTTEFTIDFGDTFTAPTLTNPNNLTVTYASSEEGVATVDADGNVTIVGAGTTIITASSEETDDFYEGSASYTLTVNEVVAPYENIAALIAANVKSGTVVSVQLTNAQVQYVNATTKDIFIADETAGIDLYQTTLTYTQGQILNGVLTGKWSPYNNLPELKEVNATGVTVTEGTIEPKVIAANEVKDNVCRLVKIENQTATETDGKYYIDDDVQLFNKYGLSTYYTTNPADYVGIAVVFKEIYELNVISFTEVAEEDVIKVGPAGYATYVTKNAVEFTGVKAYAVTKINEKSVSLQELTSAPAGTPVVVEAEEGEYACTIIESATAPEKNELTYSEEDVVSDGTIYALANKPEADGVGFYPVKSGVTIPAGKAYLKVGAEVKGFLALGDVADAINNILVETANGNIFNIAGQKVQNITKGGLYIVNGKKVFVK